MQKRLKTSGKIVNNDSKYNLASLHIKYHNDIMGFYQDVLETLVLA